MSGLLQQFRGKKVLVTGHTGFKGSWLTFLLAEAGAEVMGVALPPPTSPSHFDLLRLAGRIQHVEGDIRDPGLLTDAFARFQPEYVFHLAAQALVRQSYADPVGTFGVNVMGTVHLLEAVSKCASVRALVCVTSDKCYENLEWVWGYRENDRLGGHDPYSASKAAAEIVFSAYARSFFARRGDLGAATARAGNVIGGGDWASDRIVPDCVRAIQANVPVVLRNPGATRPWQHVLEPLSGYLLLATRLREDPARYQDAWNFGPPSTEERTVEVVARTIVSHIGRGEVRIEPSLANHHEARLLQLNCDRAHHLLGWRPRWDVERTLSATALWYKSVMEGGDAESMTRRQARDYFPELS